MELKIWGYFFKELNYTGIFDISDWLLCSLDKGRREKCLNTVDKLNFIHSKAWSLLRKIFLEITEGEKLGCNQALRKNALLISPSHPLSGGGYICVSLAKICKFVVITYVIFYRNQNSLENQNLLQEYL